MTKSKWRVRTGHETLQYFGKDLLEPDNGEIIRIAIGKMSEEQLKAWLSLCPKTARQHVLGPVPGVAVRDNHPNAALPAKPQTSNATTAKQKAK